MELLTEIYESNIGCPVCNLEKVYTVRKASRAVIVNSLKEIALLYVSKNTYYKLPGGGIEKGESIIEALNREVMEEVGAKINIVSEIGTIIEYKDRYKQLQISYCFLAMVSQIVGDPSFTKEEVNAGFKLKWVKFEDAVTFIKSSKPSNYLGKFIQKRDLAFLTQLGKIQGNKMLDLYHEK